ncbi:MAG: hypothetical protein CMJ68_20755 [Planctomycetaceae bacterium]|nr:hypothetical protein [Planctomycetaceae bacterium]
MSLVTRELEAAVYHFKANRTNFRQTHTNGRFNHLGFHDVTDSPDTVMEQIGLGPRRLAVGRGIRSAGGKNSYSEFSGIRTPNLTGSHFRESDNVATCML